MVHNNLKSNIDLEKLKRKCLPTEKSFTQISIMQVMYYAFTTSPPTKEKVSVFLDSVRESIHEIENRVAEQFTIYNVFTLIIKSMAAGMKLWSIISYLLANISAESLSLLTECIFHECMMMDSCLELFLNVCNQSHTDFIRHHTADPINVQIIALCNSLTSSWCIRKLKQLLNGNQRDAIKKLCDEQFFAPENTFFPPNVLEGVSDNVKKKLATIFPSLTVTPPANIPLADCVYYCYIAILEAENSVETAYAHWNELKSLDDLGKSDRIYLHSLCAYLLRAAASQWKSLELPAVKDFVGTLLSNEDRLTPFWQLLFLSSLKDAVLMELAKDDAALQKLRLATLKTQSEVDHLALFPFMFASDHPDNAMWLQLKQESLKWNSADPNGKQAAITSLNAIIVKSTTKRHLSFIKMSIILLCYENFAAGLATQFILDQLNNLKQSLQISDKEAKAFLMIANKPKNHTWQMDYVERFFSYQPPDEVKRSIFPRVMVNLLATAVGAPESHLYNLVFSPETMVGRAMPGSGLDTRQLMDCGFKDNGEVMINTDPKCPPFENNMLYRYAFTSTVWMAVSWSFFFHSNIPQLITDMTKPAIHFLNAWQLDGLYFCNQHNDRSNLTLLVKHSVLFRALNIFDRVAVQGQCQQIDNGHYVTQLLWSLWERANTTPLPAWLVNQFTKDSAVAYEQHVTKEILTPQTEQYQSFKKKLLDDITAAGALKTLFDYRAEISKFYSSPFLPFSECAAFITRSEQDEADDAGEEDGVQSQLRLKWLAANRAKSLIRYVSDNSQLLVLSFEVVKLIHFYTAFQKLFAYRITKEDLNLNVLDCIDRLQQMQLEPNNVIDQFKELWKQTKNVWESLRDNLSGFALCNHEDANERELPALEDSTPILAIFYKNKFDSGMLLRAIELWLDCLQRSGISQRTKALNRVNWVMQEVLPATQIDNSENSLMNLPYGVSINNMLLLCPERYENLCDLFLQHFYSKAATTSMTSRSQENLSCEVDKLEYYLLERYFAGRHVSAPVEEEVLLKFKDAVKELPTRPTVTKGSNEVIFIIRAFHNLVVQLREKSAYQDKMPSDDFQFVIATHIQRSLLQLTEVLEPLITLALKPDKEKELVENTLGQVAPPNQCALFNQAVVKSLQMKHLGKLCELVLDTLLEGSHLYRQDGGQDTLGEAKSTLKALSAQLKQLSSDGKRVWFTAIEHILKYFKTRQDGKQTAKKMDKMSTFFQSDLAVLEKQINEAIKKTTLSTTLSEAFEMSKLFVDGLTCKSYFPFLRYLHKTYAELFFAIQQEYDKSTEKSLYRELSFSANSVELSETKTVEPHQSQEDTTETKAEEVKPSQAPDSPAAEVKQKNPFTDSNDSEQTTFQMFRGIENISQTCFMNAVLQALNASRAFRLELESVDPSKESQPITFLLQRFLEELSRPKRLPVTGDNAAELLLAVANKSQNKLFPTPFVQQDAFTFWSVLKNILDEERAKGQIESSFNYQELQTTTCNTCHAQETTTHVKNAINIVLSATTEPRVSLETLLKEESIVAD